MIWFMEKGLIEKLSGKRGTYVLEIKLDKRTALSVGKLSKAPIEFRRGYYYYCGSALGKNGLYNRVRRHFSKEK